MAAVVDQYLTASPASRLSQQAQTRKWLDSLSAQGLTGLAPVPVSTQSQLVRVILEDLSNASGTRDKDLVLNIRQNMKWDSQTRLSALRLLKELSRTAATSAPLAESDGMRALLSQVDFAQQTVRRNSQRPSLLTQQSRLSSLARTLQRIVDRRDTSRKRQSIQSIEDAEMGLDPDWLVTDMALRCLNNALFLHQDARLPFSSDDIGGGHVAVALLSQPQTTPADILFLGSRLLFFSTLFEAPFNKTAVEQLDVVRIEAHCVETLVHASLEKANAQQLSASLLTSSGSEAQYAMALSDLLKAHFNICLYYPRIIEAEQKEQAQSNNAPTGTKTSEEGDGVDGSFRPELLDMLAPLLLLLTTLPIPKPIPLIPPFTHAIAALLNYPVAQVKQRLPITVSFSVGPAATADNEYVAIPDAAFASEISRVSTAALKSAPAYLARLLILADQMLARYLAYGRKQVQGSTMEDVDHRAIKRQASNDSVDLEDNLEPLLLLLRKCASEDSDLRQMLKAMLLPSDLKRDVALDKRLDLLGRLVRLMSSVTLPRLARAAGELLLAVCNNEAKHMTDAIGYGPCAGFLMNTGRASALPTSSSAVGANGRPINPITGEYLPTEAELAMDEINGMTEEEKQAEAEKLFVLFDRMNRTGVISVKDPRQTAQESGRFSEISDSVEKDQLAQLQAEEEEDERTVEREMAAFRKRKEEAHRRAMRLVARPASTTLVEPSSDTNAQP